MLYNYNINNDKLIYQVNKDNFIYDKKYIEDRYDKYGELNKYISYLRLGYLLDTINFKVNSILDVGYGNGSFLKTIKKIINNCYGYDISGYPLPEGVDFCEDWLKKDFDVVTLFDVIEHFEDPYVLKDVKSKYMMISTPWCHYISDDWFESWKHRRPNEHLWFFNEKNIFNFAKSINYEILTYSNIEDIIRKSDSGLENILTVIMKKID